jgi:hypothetical protein
VIGDADPGIAERHLAGIGFGMRHQLGNGLDRQAGVHRQNVGREQDQADRREVLDRAVRHVGEQARRDGQGAHID